MHPPEGWSEIDTGGNCTAWQMVLSAKYGQYALITQAGTPIAPTRRSNRVILSIYGEQDRQLVSMEFARLADALLTAKRISFVEEVEI